MSSEELKKECEEPFENWVLIGDGNFEKLNS
jgi:hypothetical protein